MTDSPLDQLTIADLPRPFGRYELQSILGEGGMARVFGAELCGPAGFRKQVALKVIKVAAGASLTAESVRAFVREARLGGMLKHPNIIDVYELGEAEGQFFISMELVVGMTLSNLISLGRVPPAAVVLEIATGVAAGLASAHSLTSEGLPAGLVHRDLKPSNILLSWDGGVKVVDFGIAMTRRGELAESLDEPGKVVGTLSYMSPEQLEAKPLDGSSDLFSLGMVLSELASATRLPRYYVLKRLTSEGGLAGPRLPEEHLALIDAAVPGLSKILLRCLEPKSEARHASAAELCADLDALRRRVGAHPLLRAWLPRMSEPRQTLEAGVSLLGMGGDRSPGAADPDSPTVLPWESRTNLVPAEDRFVGRESELAELGRFFDEGTRLLTVKGAGGAGKTRFVRHFARGRLEELAGGAWFVDLTEARAALGVAHSTAIALGVPLGGDDLKTLVTKVGHALAGRGPVLLVLDNFEQVVEHASATLGVWLEMAPHVRFLVTSREPLRLRSERVFTLDRLDEDTGVALFRLRAADVGARWEDSEATRAVLGLLVERLDGLPLAIELAAARAQLLSPTQLLDRLSDRFRLLTTGGRGSTGRHRTLRGVIDWSWEQLDPWEQSVMAQLSVFRGGFFMEAAEAVLDLSAWPDVPWVLDLVGSLLDKSLLHSREVEGVPRFGMYMSIRDYAGQKLEQDLALDATVLALRSAAYYARLDSDEHRDSLHTHGGSRRLRLHSQELENLLAGVDASIEAGESALATGCVLGASQLFEVTGPFLDGADLVSRVLDMEGLAEDQRMRLLGNRGFLMYRAGFPEKAMADYTVALGIAAVLGDRRSEGVWLSSLGTAHRELGGIPEALEHYKAALAIARQVGDRRREGIELGSLGIVHREQGSIPEALEHYKAALTIARQVGDRSSEGLWLGSLANVHRQQGRIPEALKNHKARLGITRELRDRRGEGHTLGDLGLLHRRQGRIPQALEHYEAALAIAQEVGDRRVEGFWLGSLGLLQGQQGLIPEALKYIEAALAIARELGHRRQEGLWLGNLGDLLLEQGEWEAAGQRFEQAIPIGDESFPLAAGAFRGSLALLRARAGDLAGARALLARAEEQLRDVNVVELGKFLCKKAQVEHGVGEHDAALAALDEAREIASAQEAGPDSELGQAIVAVVGLVEGELG